MVGTEVPRRSINVVERRLSDRPNAMMFVDHNGSYHPPSPTARISMTKTQRLREEQLQQAKMRQEAQGRFFLPRPSLKLKVSDGASKPVEIVQRRETYDHGARIVNSRTSEHRPPPSLPSASERYEKFRRLSAVGPTDRGNSAKKRMVQTKMNDVSWRLGQDGSSSPSGNDRMTMAKNSVSQASYRNSARLSQLAQPRVLSHHNAPKTVRKVAAAPRNAPGIQVSSKLSTTTGQKTVHTKSEMEYYETAEEPSFWPALAHQRPPAGFAQFDATSAAAAGLDGDARLHHQCHNHSLDHGKDLPFDEEQVASALDSGGKEWEGRRFGTVSGVQGAGVHGGAGGYGTALVNAGGGGTALCQRKLAVIRQAMWKAPQRPVAAQLQMSQTSNGSSIVSGSGPQSLASSFDYSRADSDDSPVNDSGVELKGAPIRPGALGQGSLTGDPRWSGDMCVERQAQAYRSAASGATAAAVWSGTLPPRNTKGSAFSCKVFLGGVPWDITENDLQCAFGRFGNPKIEWPAAHDSSSRNVKGHLYLIFDTEKSVKQLLGSCNYDFNQGHHNWYYKVASKRMRVKEVQVIPWQLADASYVRNGCMTTFGTKTVFVGSLHGMLTAEGLGKVLDDLFGGVVAATIDTDKYKYPIGSGRVTFNSNDSYMKALRAVFVDLRTPKFNKKIQIDPFLEDSACSICSTQVGPYFCRDLQCFSYFCHACWQWQHSASNIGHHIPLMRNPRS